MIHEKILGKIDKKAVAFFNFKKLGDKYLLTNDVGAYVFLSDSEFSKYLEGSLKEFFPEKYEELKAKGFTRNYLDFEGLIQKYSAKKQFLNYGPSLHIVVVTLRCDQKCVYCQTTSGNSFDKGLDMSQETAKMVVDKIFESPTPSIVIEFQGGEPLLNFETVKFIVEYANEKNKKSRKHLILTLVTNLVNMDEAKFDFLVKNNVSLCTSLDGPFFLHRKNRVTSSDRKKYVLIKKWTKRFFDVYRKKTYSHKPHALLTVTRKSLQYPKEIIDTYMSFGFDAIHLRCLSPLGMAKPLWKKIGYSSEEFIKFYRNALDYIILLNKKGRVFYEKTALIFLQKIFNEKDPNYLDLRSPCGAVRGQLAYNFDGSIFACDEARMLARMGDDSFRVGDVRTDFDKLMNNDVAQSLCAATILDNLPGCSSCVYNPYCGVCPIYSYVETGSIFGRQPHNFKSKINSAQLDYIFKKIQEEKNLDIFRDWLNK
jgi:His-Xaa-Ser system radical SAM maturase HxsB